MSDQRCGKCRAHGHNRLSCGKSKPRSAKPSPVSGKEVAGQNMPLSPPLFGKEGTGQSVSYGALHAAFQAAEGTTPRKSSNPKPAATIVHTPIEDRDAMFTIYAEVDGQRVGHAEFRPTLHGDDAMITTIRVHEDFRRRGIAQQMWEKVKELGFEPVHSPRREPDGEAFAAAVGGPTPPNIALSSPDSPEEERAALRKALWDWYATRPPKRNPKFAG